MIDFAGQAVIVTGAGRGIGRLFALDFAARGAAVVVNDLGVTLKGGGSDASLAEAVVDEIRAAGGTAVASGHSVATPEGGAAIVRMALDNFGRVDAVVNNAGITGNVPFEDITPEQWNQMLAIHMGGAFHVSQPAYTAMKAQGYGRFVFMGSGAGVFGTATQAHYGAAKTGLMGLSNVIAIEGAPHGILSNYVTPWAVTRMISEALAAKPEVLEMPLFKLMKPDLVPPMVVYLASGACAVSHHSFSAGAGRYARIFTGVGPGWQVEDETASAEDIAAHFAEVSATDPYYVPMSTADESAEICGRHGIDFAAPA